MTEEIKSVEEMQAPVEIPTEAVQPGGETQAEVPPETPAQ